MKHVARIHIFLIVLIIVLLLKGNVYSKIFEVKDDKKAASHSIKSASFLYNRDSKQGTGIHIFKDSTLVKFLPTNINYFTLNYALILNCFLLIKKN